MKVLRWAVVAALFSLSVFLTVWGQSLENATGTLLVLSGLVILLFLLWAYNRAYK